MATPRQRNSTEIIAQDYGFINKLLQCSRLSQDRPEENTESLRTAARKPPWLKRTTWRGQSSIVSASSKRPPNCAFCLSHLLGPAASSGASSGEGPADAAGQLCCRQGHRPRPSFRHTCLRVQGAMPRIPAASACWNRKSKLQRGGSPSSLHRILALLKQANCVHINIWRIAAGMIELTECLRCSARVDFPLCPTSSGLSDAPRPPCFRPRPSGSGRS